MTDTATLIAHYTARPARYSEAETARRLADYRTGFAINALDGAPAPPEAETLAALLASGRISEAEYFNLARSIVGL